MWASSPTRVCGSLGAGSQPRRSTTLGSFCAIAQKLRLSVDFSSIPQNRFCGSPVKGVFQGGRCVKKICRWHIFSNRPQRLCREELCYLKSITLCRKAKKIRVTLIHCIGRCKWDKHTERHTGRSLHIFSLLAFLQNEQIHSLLGFAIRVLALPCEIAANKKEPFGSLFYNTFPRNA